MPLVSTLRVCPRSYRRIVVSSLVSFWFRFDPMFEGCRSYFLLLFWFQKEISILHGIYHCCIGQLMLVMMMTCCRCYWCCCCCWIFQDTWLSVIISWCVARSRTRGWEKNIARKKYCNIAYCNKYCGKARYCNNYCWQAWYCNIQYCDM